MKSGLTDNPWADHFWQARTDITEAHFGYLTLDLCSDSPADGLSAVSLQPTQQIQLRHPILCSGSVPLFAGRGELSVALKVGQIIVSGDRRWLIRVYLGCDCEINKRRYHKSDNPWFHARGARIPEQEAART